MTNKADIPRNGWHQVITVFPASLTTVAYRYESGGWWIPDPQFNEASLVGANITPLYTQDEIDEIVERASNRVSAEVGDVLDASVRYAKTWRDESGEVFGPRLMLDLVSMTREAQTKAEDANRVIAAAVRKQCTPSREAYKAGGDTLIRAVADWIENPPEWVDSPWAKREQS